jgi:hypothetical protein
MENGEQVDGQAHEPDGHRAALASRLVAHRDSLGGWIPRL